MAWRTKNGETSDPDQDALRRGTEPIKAIVRPGDNTKPEVRAAMERVSRQAEALRRGDWHTAFYGD